MTHSEALTGMNFYLQAEGYDNIKLIEQDDLNNVYTYETTNDNSQPEYFQFDLSQVENFVMVYHKENVKAEWMIFEKLFDDTK